jgi:hypothetical protein
MTASERRVLTLPNQTRRWHFSGPVAEALCEPPFAGSVEKCRDRRKRPLPDHYRRFWRTAAERPHYKSATVRDRPSRRSVLTKDDPASSKRLSAAQRPGGGETRPGEREARPTAGDSLNAGSGSDNGLTGLVSSECTPHNTGCYIASTFRFARLNLLSSAPMRFTTPITGRPAVIYRVNA